MKRKPLFFMRPVALAAVGVFLGHGAQADTVLDFEVPPPGVNTNVEIPQTFGDNVFDSLDGVTVDGFGTPNIGLTWQISGNVWHYYLDSVWAAVQLDNSVIGDSRGIVFMPNNPVARVILKSFNFHPYYVSSERFTYNVSVIAAGTVVAGPTVVTFLSDATKDHPVLLNHTGAPGQAIELRIERTASVLGDGEIEGDAFNIAIDDIVFAQDPEMFLLNGPQVTSVSPADGETGTAARHTFRAVITDADTSVKPGSVQLRLDGTAVAPPPDVATAAGETTVTFQTPAMLASGSLHTYALSYDDTSTPALSYTQEVRFTVSNYATLPSSYASAAGSGSGPGFRFRTVLAAGAPALPSTLARAREQLAGTLVNPDTQELFENSAELGPNPDGSFDVAEVLDFDDDGTQSGNFTRDQPFPGLPSGGNNWFSTEAWLFLDLPAGYHRFGVNSDDGFEVAVGAPATGPLTAKTVLGFFDGGRGATDSFFDCIVQTAGLYRFQLIQFESDGAASCEFFSVNPLTGEKFLINDETSPAAIKSFRDLASSQPPRITSVLRTGGEVTIEWVDGVPPFQVQSSTSLAAGEWTNSGPPTPLRTATFPLQPGAGFVRVVGQ